MTTMITDPIILVTIVATFNILLGTGIFLANPRAEKNQLFAAFATFTVLWIVSNFLENEPFVVGEENLELMLRLDFVAALFTFLAWFRFCAVFTRDEIPEFDNRPLNVTIWLASGALATLSLFTPFVIHSVSFYDNVIHFETGLAWFIYALLLLALSMGGLALLFVGRKRTKVKGKLLKHRQINFIFVGFLLSVGNAIFVNLFLQTFFSISLEVSRLGIYGMVFLVGFAGYAIAKQRLFELRVAVLRALVYTVLLFGVAVAYAAFLFFMTVFFSDTVPDRSVLVTGVILTIIIAFTFKYIREGVGKFTNKLFFKEHYDSEELLSKLSHNMAEVVELEDLEKNVLHALATGIHAEKAALLLVDNSVVTNTIAVGYDAKSAFSPKLTELFHAHKDPYHLFIFEEMAEGEIKEIFYDSDIAIAIPLRVENQDVAILLLGSKRSGEPYNQQDIDLLNIFAPQAGITVQSAKAFSTIKTFNKELEQKVQERTKELKTAQEQELARAREVARLKDEFVFIAAHELQTPVAAIRGFLELMSQYQKQFSHDVQGHVNAIASASENLGQLVNDLLEISRSEAGKMKIDLEAVDIRPLIDSVVEGLMPAAKEKHIAIEIQKPGSVPAVLADPKRLREVVTNLLSNAIKYNREKGKIIITFFPHGDTLVVEFRDTGYGIPRNDQHKVFKKFFRASAEETKDVLGTGLGLFITRMLVEKMNGELKFSSVEGKGSTFAFSLAFSGTS